MDLNCWKIASPCWSKLSDYSTTLCGIFSIIGITSLIAKKYLFSTYLLICGHNILNLNKGIITIDNQP